MNGSYVNDFKAWDFFYKLFFDSCTENSVIQILGHDTYKSSTYIFAEFSSHFLLIRLPNGLWSFIIFLSKHFFWQQTKSLYKSHVATHMIHFWVCNSTIFSPTLSDFVFWPRLCTVVCFGAAPSARCRRPARVPRTVLGSDSTAE